MAREQLKNLTEPMYYLLLALLQPKHGYGIMQCISEMTENQVQVGAGTLYALLSRFEGEGIICHIMEKDRKKIYQITPKGGDLLTEEYLRLNRMVENGKRFFDNTGALLPIDFEKAKLAAEAEAQAAQEQERAEREREAEKEREETPEAEKEGARDEKKETEESGQAEPRRGLGGFRKRIFAT